MIGISVVVTVKNDEEGVRLLLENLKKQTVRPDEVIIVRSEDYGNCTRGRGRNIGVRMAKNEFIAVTDVGCRPKRDWVEKITAGLNTPKESSFASWSTSTPAKSDPSGFGRASDFSIQEKSGSSEDTRETLTKLLGKLGGELIVETLKKLEKGKITEVTQPEKSPTPYTRKLTKESGRIDWSQSPTAVERFIRAATPWPGAWTEYKDEGRRTKDEGRKLKILKTHIEKTKNKKQKTKNILIIDEMQLPGKNPVSWKQFLAGHPGAELG